MISRRALVALLLTLPVALTASCARDYGQTPPQASADTVTDTYSAPTTYAVPSASTAPATQTTTRTTSPPTAPPTTARTATRTAAPPPAARPPKPESWYGLALQSTGEYRWYTDFPTQSAVVSALQADGFYNDQTGRTVFDAGCAAYAHPLNNYSNSAFLYGFGGGSTRANAETAATQDCQTKNGVLCQTYVVLCVGDNSVG